MKIMLVDDHQEMRRLLRSLLGRLATEIAECRDGAEAVAAFTRERPDWTIMDISMEPMDGLEATRRIKTLVPEARILILTQHDTPGIRRAAHDAGASAFLSKDQLSQLEPLLNESWPKPPESRAGRDSAPS